MHPNLAAQVAADIDPERSFIEVNGLRLHAVQAGPEDGPLVILLHGFPEFWYGWRRQIGPLAEAGFRVLAPDQRGYNLSDKPRGVHAYHITNLASDVIALIDAMGRKRAHLVGHDWGAAVAWHAATSYPGRLEKLTILNVPHPAIMARTLQRNPTQILNSWYMFFFQIPALPEWLLRSNHWMFLKLVLTRTSQPGAFSEEDLNVYREAWSQPGAITAMLNWYRSAVRTGLSQMVKISALPIISVPTLMIWGVNDAALDRSMAQPSIDLCSDRQLVFFEDASHWVQHEKAAEVNELIIDFLKEDVHA
jgi:pimeloyl-ACP methyl ester carboxylesterase